LERENKEEEEEVIYRLGSARVVKNCELGVKSAALSFSRLGNFCTHFVFKLRAEQD